MKEMLTRLAARPGLAMELVAASLFANILALASPLFVIQVLNRYVAQGVDATLATLTTGVILAIMLELGFRQVRLRLASAVSARKDEDLAVGAFSILTGAKAAAVDLLPSGLRREILSGADTVESAYSPSNMAAVLDVPFALIFVIALYLINPVLALIAAAVLVVVFLAAVVSLATLRQPTRELTGVSGRRGALVSSAMSAGDTVRAFNGALLLRNLWKDELRTFHGLRRRISGGQGRVQSLTQSAQAILSVAIVAVGATLVIAGDLDVGAMIGANILAARALGPVVRLAQMSESFAKARQSLDMFSEFAKLPQERLEGSALREYKGGLQFKDVGFGFSTSNSPLFESLSVNLEPGSILIVIGANGSGKTTLGRLIVGLIEPRRGHILVDGVDLAQVVPEWWRKQIVYLPQEPRFLAASMRDNLLSFNPDLDDAGIGRLVDAAGLRRYIDESPEGIDSMIVGNGENLSLGVRRRLALARALATDGMLAILDEPTEGLDLAGRKQVYAVMNDMASRGCSIVAFTDDPNIMKGVRFVLDLNTKPVPRLIDQTLGAEASARADQDDEADTDNAAPGSPVATATAGNEATAGDAATKSSGNDAAADGKRTA